MRSRKYSLEEINILSNNPNVIMVRYGRSIEYREAFKKWAVLQSMNHPELSAIQIFEMGGFDRRIISSKNARDRIASWKSRYSKVIINNNFDNESYDKQNNLLLKNLLVRFDKLVTILGDKKK